MSSHIDHLLFPQTFLKLFRCVRHFVGAKDTTMDKTDNFSALIKLIVRGTINK